MKIIIRRMSVLVASLAALVILSGACSSNEHGGGWNDPMLNEVVRYEETPMATFSISGSASCKSCREGVEVSSMTITVVPKDDPTKELYVLVTDKLGSFYIPDLRYKSGVDVALNCSLFTGEEGVGFFKEVDVTVPDDDGDVVAVTINF